MTSTSTASGPELLEERSIGGILVHLLGLLTGFLGPAIVYAVSDDEYTRTNARHALNWHVTVLALMIVSFVTFFLGADELTVGGEQTELSLLPAPLDTVFAIAGVLLLIVFMLAILLTFVYAVVATLKAVFGSIWTYPGAIDVVKRYR
ncbi:DUF4870 domain-containing protein [Natrarchaeobius halalkaliphilus]|uniref:DUF4870 domain-containing protein n=1 Tax=Natrarchaeobius halalkaliphilus TaxID=1679091 RepID=A0A3N6M3G8_9EURY|nr:DUF4870 domain-containing protein [Natrarchaeobius halalkaliphilus]RQG86647.1 DUF4870 domain-containing protein [Natrarchaeobius halalkaliphilus]